jgi:processive 1,2-diacylglycerol beta-glucosyltransferase
MGQKQPNILILSGDLGDGHKQAANAIKEASQLLSPEASVIIEDFVKLTHPRMHRWLKHAFLTGIKSFPFIYGYLYHKTRNTQPSRLLKRFNLLGLGRLLELINSQRPDAIVCTFPVAAAAVSLLKSSGVLSIPSVTVITDYTDHAYWVHPCTDLYLVGSYKVRRSLMNKGVPEEYIRVTGIPIKSAFHCNYDKTEVRKRHGLAPERSTILIMGGGYGMISEELIELLKSPDYSKEWQWIIVCGHNDTLRLSLQETLKESPHRVTITGFVETIHELMASADLLITKPGGLTTSEALAVGLPMLLYRPLPGQEQENAKYLTETGTAELVRRSSDLSSSLKRLLDSPWELKKMRRNAIHIRPFQPGLNAWLETQKLSASKENIYYRSFAGARK